MTPYLTAADVFAILGVLGTIVILFALASHHTLEMKRLSSGYYKQINQRSDTTPPSAPSPRDSSPDTGREKASRRSSRFWSGTTSPSFSWARWSNFLAASPSTFCR